MTVELSTLERVLDRIERSAAGQQRVALGTRVEAVSRRSFGPLLLIADLILESPLSGIPGMPTSMGLLVLLIAVQLLAKRECFWLPRWLMTRSIAHATLRSSGLDRPPAGWTGSCVRAC